MPGDRGCAGRVGRLGGGPRRPHPGGIERTALLEPALDADRSEEEVTAEARPGITGVGGAFRDSGPVRLLSRLSAGYCSENPGRDSAIRRDKTPYPHEALGSNTARGGAYFRGA